MTLERDTILKDRYRIMEILGQGGMGAVYRAIDENLGVYVALKENFFSTDEYSRQFRREAIILASMKHANLPKVSDHFEIDDQGQYFVMEYIEGEDLRQRMDRLGILQDEEVIVVGAAICDALQYLHTRNPSVLHRDIKPGNIKINPEGGVYLVDFGLAKIVQGGEATTTGARAMTPGYSSPEQYGTARTDPRSDVYSLGATLYAAITGTIPEDGLARAMDQADLTSVRRRNPKAARRLSTVIEKALEIHPDDRYQSADEFKMALLKASSATRQNITMGETTITPPPQAMMDSIANGGGLDGVKSTAVGSAENTGESAGRRRRRQMQKLARVAGISAALLIIVSTVGYILASLSGGRDFFSGIDSSSGVAFAGQASATPNATAANGIVEVSATTAQTITPAPTDTPTPEMLYTPTAYILGTIMPSATHVPIVVGEDAEFNYEYAFVSDRSGSYQIWLQTLDGTTSQQLTNIEGGACQPEWSPDGTQMVFISPCDEKKDFYLDAQLFMMDIGGEVQLLLHNQGVYDPAWSPNGKYLLFTFAQDAARSQIYRWNFDSRTADIMAGVDDDQLYFDAAWSPTGRQIVFTSSRLDGIRLFVMSNVPGAEPMVLTRSGEYSNRSPIWSSVGGVIYFAQEPVESDRASLVMNTTIDMLEIENPVDYLEARVTEGLFIVPEADPSVSEDGNLILFESWPDGVNHDIYVMFANGTAMFRLTTEDSYDFFPVFRPVIED